MKDLQDAGQVCCLLQLQDAADFVRQDVMKRKEQLQQMQQQLVSLQGCSGQFQMLSNQCLTCRLCFWLQEEIQWEDPDEEPGTRAKGAKVSLLSMSPSQLRQLCKKLCVSEEGSKPDMTERVVQQADRPFAILNALTEKVLQKVVVEYCSACGHGQHVSDDSGDKDPKVAHLELQCQAAILWGTHGVKPYVLRVQQKCSIHITHKCFGP